MSCLLLVFALVCPQVSTFAQEMEATSDEGGPLEIKIIGDRILARVELQTEVWFKDTHIIIDYSLPHAMLFNFPVIRDLRFGEGEDTLKVLNEGFRMEVPRAGIMDERVLGQPQQTSELTSKYANELEQIDIVAIVGWPVLRKFGLTLDIQESSLILHPEGELDPNEVRATSELFVEGVEIIGDSVFVPLNWNGGLRGFMKMQTNSYHTILNREILDDREAGVIDEAYFGQDQLLKLSDMAAFFPQDLYMGWFDQYQADQERQKQAQAQADAQGSGPLPDWIIAKAPDMPSGDVVFVSGLSVLSGYRWVLDQNQGFVGVTRTVNSNYSEADHQFYMAAAAKDDGKLFTYLEENPEDRNVEEAVGLAFNLGLENGAPVERQISTIEYGINVTHERRKFRYVADFVFSLVGTTESRDLHSDLIISVGELALPYVSRSEQPRLRQQVQMLVGDRYLARNDSDNAWKYFLAAAFNGDPQLDPFVRFDLGRVYEAQGRDRRAYANYQRAVNLGLPPDQMQTATEALNRLKAPTRPQR